MMRNHSAEMISGVPSPRGLTAAFLRVEKKLAWLAASWLQAVAFPLQSCSNGVAVAAPVVMKATSRLMTRTKRMMLTPVMSRPNLEAPAVGFG